MSAKPKSGQPKRPRPPPTPPQPKPWDMPPLPKRGDENQNDTFAAVGVALSKWEYFEGQLGLLYAGLVDAHHASAPALRSYGVITAFSTRIDMLREATFAFFFGKNKDDLRDDVIDTLNTAKEFSTRRNEIAHGVVQQYSPKEGDYVSGFVIGPSYFAVRKKKITLNELTNNIEVRDSYAYTSKELNIFSAHFEELAEDVMRLWLEIAGIA
jgi:hypothetical protein